VTLGAWLLRDELRTLLAEQADHTRLLAATLVQHDEDLTRAEAAHGRALDVLRTRLVDTTKELRAVRARFPDDLSNWLDAPGRRRVAFYGNAAGWRIEQFAEAPWPAWRELGRGASLREVVDAWRERGTGVSDRNADTRPEK
jgi:hypothetical protein